MRNLVWILTRYENKGEKMNALLKRILLRATLPLMVLVTTVRVEGSQQLAFPGAEGFGKYAKGGRGGDVYVVTSLHDSGPGSFRHSLASATGPRTIVFDVSGTIVLKSPVQVEDKSQITIAGQTAPGKGITLRENQLAFKNCSEIIVRYLRLRLGDENKGEKSGADVMTVDYCDNVILDHLSLSWGIDGNSDYRGDSRMTLQWLLYSEALNRSIHYRGSQHAMATSIRDCQGHTTVCHNIYSTSRQRHPTLGSGSGVKGFFDVILDYRNCVDYNWSGETNFGGMKINVAGNYYKPGPCTDVSKPPMQIKDGDTTRAQGCMAGNFFEGMPESFNRDNYAAVIYTNSGSYMSTTRGKWERPTEFDMGAFKPFTQNAKAAYEFCLKYGGCSLVRDTVDKRIIENIKNGVGRIIDSQKEVGGWDPYPEERRPVDWDTDRDGMPSAWENANGLDPQDSEDRNGDRDGDGYTNLEDYLNGLVPDMTELMRNFEK